jgi:hypothetical protein
VVGALYFYFVFFRRAHPPHIGGGATSPRTPADAFPADLLPLFGEIALPHDIGPQACEPDSVGVEKRPVYRFSDNV